MGSNLVIVAIPDENDRVWKVSSEKVPHLTLLFLGEAEQVKNTEQIVEFVQHAADTMLNRFYLSVDRRDTLGADEADVLFFRKGGYDVKAVREFRNALLKDTNIRNAYDNATQFEGWQPHLTLGYPAAPANEIPDNESDRFYDVSFNKIAVWMGDFEGPEFLLKDYWDEIEAVADMPMDIAMSSLDAEKVKAGIDLLDHSGVKGMKWGVHKEKVASGAKAVGRGAKAVGRGIDNVAFEMHKDDVEVTQAIVSGARTKLKADLPNIKANHPTGGKLGNRLKSPLSAEAKAYRKDVKAAYIKHLESSANDITNAAGSRRYTLKENGEPNTSKYNWEVSTEKAPAKHADGGTIKVHPVFDEDGYIIDLETVKEEVKAVSHAEIGEEFIESLMHSGVKGMKWGVRKDPPRAVAPTATSRVPHGDKRKTKIETEGGQNHPAHTDAIKVAQAKAKLAKSGPAALSNAELRDVAQRVQLEQQVKQLVMPKGQKFVRRLLGNQGNQAANQFVSSQVKKKVSFA